MPYGEHTVTIPSHNPCERIHHATTVKGAGLTASAFRELL